SSRRRHTRSKRDWSSDVCSSDLQLADGFEFLFAVGLDRGRLERQLRMLFGEEEVSALEVAVALLVAGADRGCGRLGGHGAVLERVSDGHGTADLLEVAADLGHPGMAGGEGELRMDGVDVPGSGGQSLRQSSHDVSF